jgi:HSP20 family molecular chaperone IbpA
VEVPGIKSPSEVTVTWTGHRALLLTGKVERPDYGMKVEEDAATPHPGGIHLLIGERRTGPFRRYINFPTDVENVSVVLEAGLLKVRAPKKGFSAGEKGTVEVKHE